MLKNNEQLLNILLKKYKFNDSIINKVGKKYLEINDIEEILLYLESFGLSETVTIGLVLYNIMLNDPNNVLSAIYNVEAGYLTYLSLHYPAKIKKIKSLVDSFNSNKKDLSILPVVLSFTKLPEDMEGFISFLSTLDPEMLPIIKKIYGTIFFEYYDKIKILSSEKKSYALKFMKGIELDSQKFKIILTELQKTEDELVKYYYDLWQKEVWQKEGFVLISNKLSENKINTLMEELKKFDPKDYEFGYSMITRKDISKREDQPDIIKYISSLNFDEMNDFQKKAIKKMASNSCLLFNHSEPRNEYIEDIKYIVDFILKSELFINGDEEKQNVFLELICKEAFMYNADYHNIIDYLDTLTKEELEFIKTSSSFIAPDKNIVENCKMAIAITTQEKQGKVVIGILRNIDRYFDNYSIEDEGKSKELKTKIMNIIKNYNYSNVYSVKKLVSNKYGLFLGGFDYDSVFDAIDEDEKNRIQKYFVASELIRTTSEKSTNSLLNKTNFFRKEKPELKDANTQDLINCINLLLTIPQDKYPKIFIAIGKAYWGNKYKVGYVLSLYKREEIEDIVNIVTNHINQNKTIQELIDIAERKLSEKKDQSYDLCRKLLQDKNNCN